MCIRCFLFWASNNVNKNVHVDSKDNYRVNTKIRTGFTGFSRTVRRGSVEVVS